MDLIERLTLRQANMYSGAATADAKPCSSKSQLDQALTMLLSMVIGSSGIYFITPA